MSSSLRDQLLKTGLVSEGQVKTHTQQSKKQRRKDRHAEQAGLTSTGEDAAHRARQAQAQKLARDRGLNEERERAKARKALRAQMYQLLRAHRLNVADAEARYHFMEGNRIKSVYVTEEQHAQLLAGQLAFVLFGVKCYLVQIPILEKARALDPNVSFHLHEEKQEAVDPDDPYADYKVPDDLKW